MECARSIIFILPSPKAVSNHDVHYYSLLRFFHPKPKGEGPGLPVHTAVKGHLVFIRFGSIGRGILPLIKRHINYNTAQTLPSSNHLLSLHTSSKSTASSHERQLQGNHRGNVAPTSWLEGHGCQSQCRCRLCRCHGGAPLLSSTLIEQSHNAINQLI